MQSRIPMQPGMNPMQPEMNPMQNLMSQMLNAMRQGVNPIQFMSSIAGNNAPAARTLQAVQGKNHNQLMSMLNNACKERGITPEQFAGQFGLQIPR